MSSKQTMNLLVLTSIISLFAGAVGGGSTVLWLGQNTAQQTDKMPSASSSTQTAALSEDDQVIAVVKKASPAVVSINVSKEVATQSSANINPFDNFFSDPFNMNPFQPSQPQTQQQPDPSAPKQMMRVGGGSGFFVSADGLIATNKHVVSDDAASYSVTTSDGKEWKAKVVALDPVLDLAIVKVDGTGFTPLELGDSDKMSVGQTAIAIGYALAEFENSVTKGVISGINRRIVASGDITGPEVIEAAIQTDAAINPGNSGGPLLDLNGKVIGVNTAVSQDAQSLGFAIPSNLLQKAVESVAKYGRIVRPWIGVRYIMIDDEVAKKNNLKVNHGALIARGETRSDLAVMPGSPGDKAGLRENDIILSINGTEINEKDSLSSELQRYAPGDKITLKILRQDKQQDIVVTLEEKKP